MIYHIIPDEHGNPILTTTDESIGIRIKGEEGQEVTAEEAYAILGDHAPQELKAQFE